MIPLFYILNMLGTTLILLHRRIIMKDKIVLNGDVYYKEQRSSDDNKS